MLWQPIRPFEFTSPVIDVIKYPFLALKPFSTFIFANPFLRSRFTKRLINERIVETPFIMGHLPQLGAKILDVGACESPISLMLACLGYAVTTVDLRPYPFSHPNLRVIQGDITNINLKAEYDAVICLSTIEHIGLPVYGSELISAGDTRAIKQIHRLLRPGGYLLLTTPVARQNRRRPAWREYNVITLKRLLRLFKSVKLEIGVKDASQQWRVVSNLPSDFFAIDELVNAVALVIATK